ncbi:DUF2865 domain-containing protein [Hyphomicrobium sp. 1Nfss2.1]|uniref:DUF2865 domain-containing protein n=1 Tax=Hyphomicrobium sp. 1Nfss2.1 TaxID=3413936 RepID=UPI003C79B1F9
MRKARARRHALGAAVLAAVTLAAYPALAQGWWPWSSSEPERPPIPDEPVYRQPQQSQPPMQQPMPEPAPGAQLPPPAEAPAVNWSTKNPICLQLEQRLVQDGQRSNGGRDRLPAIEAEMSQVERAYEQAQSDLERSDCYEYFLFSKTLRRSRRCLDIAQQRDQAQRRLSELEGQQQQIESSSVRSYREEIVRELARNNCGANYTQEARRYDRGSGGSIWQDEDEGGSFSNRWSGYGGSSGATYRTVCVRLCDGYYFPVSFSTLPSHFDQDAQACQSKCAAPAELYYYQNPGAGMDQSVSFQSQQPYTDLKTAFRYRKELVKGCSCKEAEYVDPNQSKRADGSIGADSVTGWEARSEADARRQQ